MLLIHCPYCKSDLPELEFTNAGEAHLVRPTDMATMSDHDFEVYFFVRGNPKGVNLERWRHAHGCNRFFNAIRDTVTDRFLKVYPSGEPRPSDAEVKALLDAEPEGRKDGGAIVGTNDVNEVAS